jgi:hypothetical protein
MLKEGGGHDMNVVQWPIVIHGAALRSSVLINVDSYTLKGTQDIAVRAIFAC